MCEFAWSLLRCNVFKMIYDAFCGVLMSVGAYTLHYIWWEFLKEFEVVRIHAGKDGERSIHYHWDERKPWNMFLITFNRSEA